MNNISILFDQFLRTEAVQFVLNASVSAVFIAFVATLFTEAIKITYEKVFFKRKAGPFFSWCLNLVTILSTALIYSFTLYISTSLLNRLLNTFLTTIVGWAISVIVYDLLLKLFLNAVRIVYVKLKDYLVDSETDLIDSTMVRNKSMEILRKKLAEKKLQHYLEDKRGKEDEA